MFDSYEVGELLGEIKQLESKLEIARAALRRISAADTTSDIDGLHEGKYGAIADEALEKIR